MTKTKRSNTMFVMLLVIGGAAICLQVWFYFLDEIAKAIVGAW